MDSVKVNQSISVEDLYENGFRKMPGENMYVLHTPAYRYNNKQPIIFLEFSIIFGEDEKRLVIDCKDLNNNIYIPFYNNEYTANNKVLEIVNKKCTNIINNLKHKKILINKRKGKKKTNG